jgi:pilus assembly protein Flp/PilA
MKKLLMSVGNFMQEEDGVTAIEYGLLAALIAVMIVAGATLIGKNLDTLFMKIGGLLTAPAAPPAP